MSFIKDLTNVCRVAYRSGANRARSDAELRRRKVELKNRYRRLISDAAHKYNRASKRILDRQIEQGKALQRSLINQEISESQAIKISHAQEAQANHDLICLIRRHTEELEQLNAKYDQELASLRRSPLSAR